MQVFWTAKVQKIKCMNEECDEINYIWENKIKEGYSWNCNKCQSKHDIVLGISFSPEIVKEATSA